MSRQDSIIDLCPFQFHGYRIRISVDSDAMIWWVAADIGAVLDYPNIANVVRRLDDDEKGLRSMYTPGGMQEVWCVNEAGLYTLILGSRKLEAKAFKRWVTHEVLPQIRQRGAYSISGSETLRPSPHLPPPPRYAMVERAHVSEHLLAVWSTLRQADEPLSNADIMTATRMKEGVVRKWTRYLLHLGLLDLYEMAPRHLFAIAPQADKRHAAYFQRLERLSAIIERRQQRLFAS